MSWFSKKTQQSNNTNLKTMTPTTSDQTRQKSETSRSDLTMKMQTAVAGGKAKQHRTRKKRILTEADYNAIHTLFESGLPLNQIAVAIGISAGHVGTLLNYDRWDDYCEYKKQVNEERKIQREQQLEQAREAFERKQIEVKTDEELEQWQFIVGWSTDEDRLKANAVRDLAKALGLRVEE